MHNKTSLLIDDLFHICIGVLPIIYIFAVPGLGISVGTLIIIAFLPHTIMYIVKEPHKGNALSCFFYFLFYTYLCFRADGNIAGIVMYGVIFVYLLGIIRGSIISDKLRTTIEWASLINASLIVMQTMCYYSTHIKLQVIPKMLVYQPYMDSYVFSNAPGLYRPSALFLEPSHYAQYCIFALISILFPAKGAVSWKKAALLTIGCVLTTSGMGIVLTFAIYAWYFLFNKQRIGKKFRVILMLLPFACIGLLMLSQTSIFQSAMLRIFSNVDGYNAVSGRMHNWGDTVGKMSGWRLWIGYGDSKIYEWYLTGLADYIYKYGIISVILQTVCLLHVMIKRKNNYVWCCSIVFLGLFCIAHLTNYIAHIFYFGIVLAEAATYRLDRN